MIVLNAVVSFAAWAATGGGWCIATDELGQTVWIIEEMILQYGHGLRPWQWITSNFLHGDILHLLGNMFCLWGFGLVTEGKVGWWRFLTIYFGIGVAQCAFEQTLMLGASPGGSLGASSIIYGLLAMSMVWAPQNDMNCVFLFFFRPIVFDASLYAIATVALLIQIGTGWLVGLAITSQALHLMGAAAGFSVGIFMLKKDMVDCEGWDLFSVWSGGKTTDLFEEDDAAAALLRESHDKLMTGASNSPSVQSAPDEPFPGSERWTAPDLQPTIELDSAELTALRSAVAVADPARAFTLFEQLADDPLNWPLPEKELVQTITLFHKQGLWNESIPAMATYLANFSERDTKVRLKLAHVLMDAARRPRQALAVLEKLNAPLLSEKESGMLQKLIDRAQEAMADAASEPPTEDW
jgi:membrane associated rhomboid family serine protease